MDKGRGTSSKKKEAELQSLEEKAQAASKAQMASLSDVNKAIKEATTDNSVKDNKDKTQESKTNTSSNLEAISKNENNIKNSNNTNDLKSTETANNIEKSQVDKKQIIHTSLDVYL